MTYSKEITEVLSQKQGTPLSSLHTCLKQQVWLESPTMLLPTLGNQRQRNKQRWHKRGKQAQKPRTGQARSSDLRTYERNANLCAIAATPTSGAVTFRAQLDGAARKGSHKRLRAGTFRRTSAGSREGRKEPGAQLTEDARLGAPHFTLTI